ncbi:hypothetical protein KLP28_06465 [Nocardioidaceae bacterium]|nr:hypothetical protein KLP28_06465 [Nocardioidaceae bacterium]
MNGEGLGETAGVAVASVVVGSSGVRRPDLADGRAWPGGVVTWHADVPPRYRWSVRHGVRAWNRTATGVRLVRAPADTAALRIVVADVAGAAARATVGRQLAAPNRITIDRVPLVGWQQRQVYGRVVAHEIGHVLGLRHSEGLTCGLMEAALETSCTPRPVAGRYACRWIGPAVGDNVVARYGGDFRLGPRWCRLGGRSS